MARLNRIELADFLQTAEIEKHILVQEEDSVRDNWWRASCELHNWYTTGSQPNVEDAAAEHVARDHPPCADVDPDSPADAPLYCRLLPGHSDDHFNGGRTWPNLRETAAIRCGSECSEAHTYVLGECEAAVEPMPGGRSPSHYFATDHDRESFLGYFGGKLDTWFTPEFAAYVRSGEWPAPADGSDSVPAKTNEPDVDANQPVTTQDEPPAEEYETWRLIPYNDSLAAENRRLWERAAQSDYQHAEADLRAAKLRLVLASVLQLFTETRRGRRDEVRTGWVEAGQVDRWRRVFDETCRAAGSAAGPDEELQRK